MATTVRTVGIDPSLAGSALVELGDDGQFISAVVYTQSAVECRRVLPGVVFVPVAEAPRGDRAAAWSRVVGVAFRLARVVADLPRRPDVVAVEEPAPAGRGAQSASAVHFSQLHGVLREELNRWGFAFLPVEPNLVKLHATGKGNADKRAMIGAALDGADVEFTTLLSSGLTARTVEALADAYWIARLGQVWALVRAGRLDPERLARAVRRPFLPGGTLHARDPLCADAFEKR